MSKSNRPDIILFLDDHRGIYIPRDFAQCVDRDCVRGIEPADYEVLENPDHDLYWDVWAEICDQATLVGTDGVTYHLWQDGALWLVPDGMEWSDEQDWFVWSVESDESEVTS